MSRIACLVALIFAGAPAGAQNANLTPLYFPIRAQLRLSAVPVLLPTMLPPAFGAVQSVAVIDAGNAGYYVGFSPVAQCAGALACAFVHIAGYVPRTRLDRSYRRDRVVRLPDGTRGFFRPADCSGSSCTEAQLVFERGTAVYELDAKIGRTNLGALETMYRHLQAVR